MSFTRYPRLRSFCAVGHWLVTRVASALCLLPFVAAAQTAIPGTTTGRMVNPAAGGFEPRSVLLARGGQPGITIVYGEADALAATTLRDGLRQALGVALPMVRDDRVLKPGAWQLAEEWSGKSLLMLGNIHTNRAVFPLYARRLVGASAGYPGAARYELRTLFAPLRRGVDMVFVGGSDVAGVEAGVRRLLQVAGRPTGVRDGALARILELGSAAGPDAAPATLVSGEFADAVGTFYWYGNLKGAQRARDMMLGTLASPKPGWWHFAAGQHYEAERYYRALRQFLVAGALDDDARRQIDGRLLVNALENRDRYMVRAVTADSESVNRGLDRHLLAGVLAQFVLFEYLDQVTDVPEDRRAAVRAGYELLRGHVESFVRHGRYQANREGKEGLDCVSALADLYLYAGDERLVRNGVFQRMADNYVANVDNLGCQAGQDSYITSMPGEHYAGTSGGLSLLAAAYFHRDSQYRWLCENLKGFSLYWGNRFRARFAPELLSLPLDVASVAPERYMGVSILPMDPWAYETLKGKEVPEAILRIDTPFEKLFGKAVFRDGGTSDDAYLMLQGVNTGAQTRSDGFQGNAIVRYTELGSLLLFNNTQRETSWTHNVVSTTHGEHDPQAAACVLESHLRSPVVSAVRSLHPADGGVAWTRSIFRRHGGYFLVLDEMTAQSDDTYHFTCRWRSFHPGQTDGQRAFQAMDGQTGTALRLVSADAIPQTVRQEPRDGATEPFILRQQKDARLRNGESASFQNLFYASNDKVRRDFDVRRVTPRIALVKGNCAAFAELAILGPGGFGPTQTASCDGRLAYLSEHGLMASDARKVVLAGRLSLESSDTFNLLLTGDGKPAIIENPHAKPIEIAFRSEAGTALGTPDAGPLDSRAPSHEGQWHLEPGEHTLIVSGLPTFFQAAKAELTRLWDKTGAPIETRTAAEPATSNPAVTISEVWRYEGIRPPLQKHQTLRASAEPPTSLGKPFNWVDRIIKDKPELGAGWAEGVEGAAILDLGREVDVDSVRVIGTTGVFKEGDTAFDLLLSNDGFQRDLRRVAIPSPRFEFHYAEMLQYMYTYQLPTYVLPVGQRARQVKVMARRREGKAPISFNEIEVVAAARAPTGEVRLTTHDFTGTGRSTLLATSGDRLVMLSPEGARLWEQQLDSRVLCQSVADVNSDGQPEIIAFTIGEKLHVFNPDGSRRFVHDVRQGQVGGHTVFRPAYAGAWKPDRKGNREYFFLPHVMWGRVSPEPELEQHVTPSLGSRGGKHAFTIPDITGDGVEELVVVGGYGLRLSVIDSSSDLIADKIRYVTEHGLHGHSCGNEMIPLYFDGSVVRDTRGNWLGIVAINPGGVDYFAALGIKPMWNHFSHAPSSCFGLHDITGDGVPEILIGREDGFLTAYAAADGRVVRKVYVGREVRTLGAAGRQIAVGTDKGLVLLDTEFKVIGFRPGGIRALGVLEGSSEGIRRLAVAYENGTIAGLTARASE